MPGSCATAARPAPPSAASAAPAAPAAAGAGRAGPGSGQGEGGAGEAEVVTLGCRLNAWESAVIAGHLHALSLPFLVVNSCAVTAEAERQTRQALRRLRRRHPRARIIATGCAVTLAPESWAGMEAVDAVLANGDKLNRRAWAELAVRLEGPGALDALQEAEAGDRGGVPPDTGGAGQGGAAGEGEDLRLFAAEAAPSSVRAFVEIQHGCDHRCTFCTIPFARGPARSVPLPELAARLRRLAEGGVREAVLTGVDIASWGRDIGGGADLAACLEGLLAAVPELPRIRLSSLDPAALDERFFRLFAGAPRLQPQLHLSAQAGDDLVLKRMKRRHGPDDLLRVAEAARRARPGVALGADLIAGFPTESEEAFRRGLALMERLRPAKLHVFAYSERPGTPAARMPQVPPAERRRRAAALRALGARLEGEYEARLVGARREALGLGDGSAHLPEGLRVPLAGTELAAGAFAEVRLAAAPGPHNRAEGAQDGGGVPGRGGVPDGGLVAVPLEGSPALSLAAKTPPHGPAVSPAPAPGS